MNTWKEIESILEDASASLDSATRESLIQRISIYHEEITLQNSELKRSYKELNKIKNDYQELFDFAPLAYLVIDNLSRVVNANSCAIDVFDDIIDMPIIDYVSSVNKGEFYVFLDELFSKKKARLNALFKSKDGFLHMEILARALETKKNQYILTFLDFEKNQNEIQRINNMAYKDYLTGLYNRRYFDKFTDNIVIQKDLPFSVIFADVNGLKVINDAFGHMVGDMLLKKASAIMSDLCEPDYILARLGGDEFGILLANTSSEEAGKIVDKLKLACSDLRVNDISCSVSFGTATMEGKTQIIDDILNEAEDEMYNHKLLNEVMTSSTLIQSIFDEFCAKYPVEKAHAIRVSEHMKKMAQYYAYSERDIENMRLAGLYHDIGKIAIPDAILTKPGKLTAEEWDVVLTHPRRGYEILAHSTLRVMNMAAIIALTHHEKWDGTGYPDGLKGSDIHIYGRITAIADVFDALGSERCYKKAWPLEDILAYFREERGKHFDPLLTDLFFENLDSFTAIRDRFSDDNTLGNGQQNWNCNRV